MTMEDLGLIGTVEIDRGDGAGYEDLGRISALSVKINGNEVLLQNVESYPMGYEKALRGLLDVTLELTWEDIADIDLWQIVMNGGTITTTTAGTTAVTDEHVTLTTGVWKALAYAADFKYDCTVSVDEIGGDTTHYVEGTDYYVDRRKGHLIMISGAGITTGDTVHVDYVYNTYAGKYFTAQNKTEADTFAIRLVKPLIGGKNLRIQHGKGYFVMDTELPLAVGEKANVVGVKSTIRFLKDVGGAFGDIPGRWEIYTP